ncbi:hypothetical protein Desor_2260 [Desulfosporosinus orientis DSM 765]|uniref:Uncharacterized protein n=1 Tax=Desulfosporosinus orientis (strain ATCC 19365 / DSM 765 / NCIMB 8382 / VKM B-1628 / Singapore I) TaxID=768706 RepID=G7WB77_DESOD|nr:hypothetical protein [Desulfosporosinus orientis]AET67858.1 hypothetical protein Desor_2260 [Desulfosporosinus orientis DSM 765]
MGGITLFVVVNALFPLFIGIFAIYFFVNVMRFMKEKIKLDEQRIEQTNRFIEIYKSNKDFNN